MTRSRSARDPNHRKQDPGATRCPSRYADPPRPSTAERRRVSQRAADLGPTRTSRWPRRPPRWCSRPSTNGGAGQYKPRSKFGGTPRRPGEPAALGWSHDRSPSRRTQWQCVASQALQQPGPPNETGDHCAAGERAPARSALEVRGRALVVTRDGRVPREPGLAPLRRRRRCRGPSTPRRERDCESERWRRIRHVRPAPGRRPAARQARRRRR